MELSASTELAAAYAVIMAGGRGVRLWPLSREDRGKQFLPLAGKRSLLRQTVERVLPLVSWDGILLVLGEGQLDMAMEELPELSREQFLCEPERKNTAPAIALAASRLSRVDPEGTMFVLPADHVVTDEDSFRQALRAAARAAKDDALVTLGINPTRPETGYGYLEIGESYGEYEGLEVRRVLSFVEKPSKEKAIELVRGARHLWNSGIFIWSIGGIVRALDEHLPDISRNLLTLEPETLLGGGSELREVYQSLPSVSIDYGVMEKAGDVLAVPSSFGWSDLGSWLALDEVWSADPAGNRVRGDLFALASRGITCYGGKRLVAAVGVRDLIIVDTPDALLVCAKDSSQMVRDLVDGLDASDRRDLL